MGVLIGVGHLPNWRRYGEVTCSFPAVGFFVWPCRK